MEREKFELSTVPIFNCIFEVAEPERTPWMPLTPSLTWVEGKCSELATPQRGDGIRGGIEQRAYYHRISWRRKNTSPGSIRKDYCLHARIVWVRRLQLIRWILRSMGWDLMNFTIWIRVGSFSVRRITTFISRVFRNKMFLYKWIRKFIIRHTAWWLVTDIRNMTSFKTIVTQVMFITKGHFLRDVQGCKFRVIFEPLCFWANKTWTRSTIFWSRCGCISRRFGFIEIWVIRPLSCSGFDMKRGLELTPIEEHGSDFLESYLIAENGEISQASFVCLSSFGVKMYTKCSSQAAMGFLRASNARIICWKESTNLLNSVGLVLFIAGSEQKACQ